MGVVLIVSVVEVHDGWGEGGAVSELIERHFDVCYRGEVRRVFVNEEIVSVLYISPFPVRLKAGLLSTI